MQTFNLQPNNPEQNNTENNNANIDEQLQAEAKKIAMKAVNAIIDENIQLQRIIKKRDEKIKILESEINELEYKLEKLPRTLSPSNRDKPVSPKYRIAFFNDGTNNQRNTEWFCPTCDSLISNWEPYCTYCGQRLGERTYDPNLEI